VYVVWGETGGCRGGGKTDPVRGLAGGRDEKLDSMLDVGVVGVLGGDCDATDDMGESGKVDVGGVAGTTSG